MENLKKRRIKVPQNEPFDWIGFNTLMIGLMLVVLIVVVEVIKKMTTL